MQRFLFILAICSLAATAGIVLGSSARPTEAAFPGANGNIAFYSTRDGNPEIYVMAPDGSSQTRITNDPENDWLPSWSPDGSKIAFVSYRDGNAEVYVMNADGSDPTRLTDDPGLDHIPKWSPDGSKIVFTSDRDGDFEIYVMNVDGGEPWQLTDDPARDNTPAWSPDGSQIAFASDRDGDSEIYAMNVDGSNLVPLTSNSANDGDPDWSPDSSKIVFRSDRDQSPGSCFPCAQAIYVMNADGTEQTRLSIGGSVALSAAWSPNGAKIALSRSDGANPVWGIYVMDADGSNEVNLTPSKDRGPSWQPLQSVGGIAEFPAVASAPLEAEGSSGLGAGVVAGIVAAVTAGALALGGAAWYARKRTR